MNNELIAKIREYREYKQMIDEMESIVEAIADELKAYMTTEGKDKMIIGEYKLSFIEATRKDVDRKNLKKNTTQSTMNF